MNGYPGKRLFDLIITIPILILTSPIMLVLAILVRVKMGSPIIFRHQRPGLHSAPFTMLKFRTMTNATDNDGNLLHDLHRITPFGEWLRRTSFDELPQFINVLKGDMSLIGPRPLLMKYLELFTPEQARRHEVRPGITGWAQVSGRNDTNWEERFSRDIWYVDHCSFVLDCRIIFLTIKTVLTSDTSVEKEHKLGEFKGWSN
ncbi:MAG: sugar transferase [Chloroflexota bacterium]|nr:sugar transferase [Chloroflexota bacterium]NOG63790.1 sugar transferase [Chloroflexota bacterium]GIK64976.1 MAG: sugar transferase [Chloroflexota bacterium]